jgi:hypothetical protein
MNGYEVCGKNYLQRKNIFNQDGVIVGHVKGKSFIKHARGSIHMLRYPRGWANDKTIINDLQSLEVQKIKIHDDESGIIYYTSLSNFTERSFEFNRGHGKQMCLPLKYWQVKNKRVITQPSLLN